MKPTVFFSREITPEKVLELYRALGRELPGRVAVKVHSGEEGNQNFLPPELCKDVVKAVNGTVVECNTAYDGERNETRKHKKLLEDHGWSRYFDVDLLDAEGPDLELEIPNGKVIKKNYIGKDLADYDIEKSDNVKFILDGLDVVTESAAFDIRGNLGVNTNEGRIFIPMRSDDAISKAIESYMRK